MEATNNVFEPSRLAPGDAVPLLRCAPMVVVDGLEVVVLVVPARDDGVAAARPRKDVTARSSRRPLRHRRDACSMAWRCRFFTARRGQHGRVIAVKVDIYTGRGPRERREEHS